MRPHISSIAYIALAAFLFFLTSCQEEHPARDTSSPVLPTAEVHVMTVTPESIPTQTEVMGTVQPVYQAAVSAKVTGTIKVMDVQLGSRVKKGDLLVKISAEEISAKVIQAQAQLTQVKRNLDREQKLLKQNAATSENVKSLQDMHRVSEAVYHEAQTMLGYTEISAPFDSQVTRKMANVGDLATPGMPLLLLENSQEMQIVASIPEGLLLQIKAGDHLLVSIPSADLTLTGTVAEIAPAADPQSRTAPIKINIEKHPQLRSGQFARVALPGNNTSTIFVPTSAVNSFGQMERIFLVQNNKARLRLVRTGSRSNDRIEILAGLNPGDQIITDNNTLLVDGQPLTITP